MPVSAHAFEQPQKTTVIEQSVLNDFVKKMRSGYSRANVFLQEAGIEKKPLDLRGLPDGEILILDVRLLENSLLEGSVLSEISQQRVYLSMRDMINVLDFPIEYDPVTQNFSGWYIRENRTFELDKDQGIVRSHGDEYNIADNILVKDDDLYFPLDSYQNWFGLTLDLDVSSQSIKLDADPPLPVMERIARRKIKQRVFTRKPASLPRGNDDYKLLTFPQVDVNTRSSFRKPESGDSVTSQNVSVRTAGEFAYGTLNTNLNGNNEDGLTNARVSYLQESPDPELLGPLGARRFEVGDVVPTRVPITGSAPPETGVRITNANPLVRQNLPSTQISGYIFPDWDVELYRGESLVSFVETDDSGFYSFDNVRLFSDRNAFRVVAYGPQGEVREENVSVPYDPNREAAGENIYDVTVSFQRRQFYNKFDTDNEDKDTPHFVGFFETPLTGNTALRIGGRYRQEEGEQKAYASAGISTSYAEALINATVASDEEGELGSEFVVTRQFGPNNFRADLDLATDGYRAGPLDSVVETLSNRYALEGPVPFGIGSNPRYSTSFNYSEDSAGENNYSGVANFSTSYNRLGFNQNVTYNDGSERVDGAAINSNTSVTGSVGKNVYRGRLNYEIKPDNELDSLFASWRRRVGPQLDTQLEVGHRLSTDVSELSAQVNWRPEHATITPRFRYDSDGNVEATLSSRFGLTRNPDPGEFLFTGDFVTATGSINAFVFLDKDGNNLFDGDDEPIQNARVLTPQNGGGADTSENGVAFISRLRPNIITDVFVEPGSLEDPFWIAAHEGVSVLPRTGTNVRVDIPVHNSGEVDGIVYAQDASGGSRPLRGISLSLYSEDGEIVQSTISGPDGFYLFSLVPPGRYALNVGDSGLPREVRRPRPQFVEIGYDGTTIFGNDIILDSGEKDIPSEIVANLDDYKALHPHIDFSKSDYKIALNLGAYKSRLFTSFMWYRLKSRYAPILAGTQIYVPPSQSYALPKTGEHVLRVGLQSENIDDAYNRCRALVARDLYCKVEIYPTAQQQTLASASGK